MPVKEFLNYNGEIFRDNKLLISANNRSFRFGDGCFETMKIINKKILLEEFHFERLFSSLEILQFKRPEYFTADYLRDHIIELAIKNNHQKLARVRLTIFRGNGNLYDVEDHFPNYIIQSRALNSADTKFTETGMAIDIYKDARKACDQFSHIKTNNFLCYVMAALWAKNNNLNDALILNSYNRIADATIANVFIVKDGIVKTPALAEGCINGVIRKYLLKCLREENMAVEETEISVEDVLNASEIFLTNSISGIKWVKTCATKIYRLQLASILFEKFINPICIRQ